jgi:ribosomal protein S18 acetylase RimI-like enzyme
MAEVSVRRARREDWPRMVELDRQLATFEKLPLPTESEAGRLCSLIFDQEKVEALVAERGGRIEGMAIFWEGLGSSFRVRPFLYLEDLVVDESARSGGVGEALMAALAREGVRRGAMRIDWAVLDWNVNAIRFYRRIGGGPQQNDWIRYSLPEDAMRKLAGAEPQAPPSSTG